MYKLRRKIIDCFLVPSIGKHAAADSMFTVHWLNNKELMFSLAAEKILAEALISAENKERYEFPLTPSSANNTTETTGISDYSRRGTV